MNFETAYPRSKMAAVEEHLRGVWRGEIQSTYSCVSMAVHYGQRSGEALTAVRAAESILKNAAYPGYTPPRMIIDYGTVSTAAYWGGEVKLPVGGCLSIEPVIHSAKEALLASPGDPEGGDAARGLTSFREVSRILDTDRLYCTTPDFQGPLTTAALLWEQTDFMVSMYEEPEVVHEFLDRVTTQLIKIIRAYIQNSGGRVCSNTWPYVWLPVELGVVMTEDYMPLLSAELYKEFGIPYVERISREFGGLFLHCCGEYEHQLENLVNSDINILGLEFHYPHVRLEALLEAFGNRVLLVPYMSPKGFEVFKTRAEYFRHLKSVMTDEARFWFILDPDEADFEEQLELVQSITGP